MATYALDTPLPAGLPLVLDTNAVLSLWMFEDPALARLRVAIEEGAFTLFTRDDCLDELARVLAYSQFKLSPERQAEIAAAYRARCTHVPASEAPACELPASGPAGLNCAGFGSIVTVTACVGMFAAARAINALAAEQ